MFCVWGKLLNTGLLLPTFEEGTVCFMSGGPREGKLFNTGLLLQTFEEVTVCFMSPDLIDPIRTLAPLGH